MRKMLIFLVLFLFFGQILNAQDKEPIEKGMFFKSREDGEKAFHSNNFRYYIPDPNNIKVRPPRSAKGLPCTYIVLEYVRESKIGSPSWVLLPPGTPGEFDSKGNIIIDGRCWNKIIESYPLFEEYIPKSMLSQLRIPGPPGKNGYTPRKGIDYFDGKDGEDFKSSPLSFLEIIGIGIGAAAFVELCVWVYHQLADRDEPQKIAVISDGGNLPPSGTKSGGGTLPPSKVVSVGFNIKLSR